MSKLFLVLVFVFIASVLSGATNQNCVAKGNDSPTLLEFLEPEDAVVEDLSAECRDVQACTVDCQDFLQKEKEQKDKKGKDDKGKGKGGASVLCGGGKKKEDWYKESCPVNWKYDLSPFLKNEQGNYDPLAISAYYYGCVIRNYQECGKPLSRSSLFQSSKAVSSTKRSQFKVKVLDAEVSSAELESAQVQRFDFSKLQTPLAAKVSLPNDDVVNLIKKSQNAIVTERNSALKSWKFRKALQKQKELNYFISQRNKFAQISSDISKNTDQASWLQVATLDQYKQLNDLLQGRGIKNDGLNVTDIDKNYDGCTKQDGRQTKNRPRTAKIRVSTPVEKVTRWGKHYIDFKYTTKTVELPTDSVSMLITQLGSVDQKTLFQQTVYDVNQIPILPSFDKVQEAFQKFPIAKLYWEIYTLLSTFKNVCQKSADWKVKLTGSLKLLVFEDNLKLDTIKSLTINQFFAHLVHLRYTKRVEAFNALKQHYNGNTVALDIITNNINTLIAGFVDQVSSEVDDGSTYCNCLTVRNVYNQIQAGTFFYTSGLFSTSQLKNAAQKPIPERVKTDCNSCLKK